jgi:uncharacterized membrane protein YdfJ with MMPL/SSD domain
MGGELRTLLIPSVLVLIGKWNWWPSRLVEGHDEAATLTA